MHQFIIARIQQVKGKENTFPHVGKNLFNFKVSTPELMLFVRLV